MAGSDLSERLTSPSANDAYGHFRRLTRVFVPPSRIQDHTVELSEPQARHLIRVLRKSVGDEIAVLDGTGGAWIAVLDEATKNRARARFTTDVPNPEVGMRHVELVVPPLKGEKMDFVLQKCTEIGVSVFHVVPMERSIARVRDNDESKLNRYRSIIVSAAEQCGAFILPKLNIWTQIDDFLCQIAPAERYIAWEEESRGSNSQKSRLNSLLGGQNPCILATGPEGGLSAEEVGRWRSTGFESISLGARVLRAETAPMVFSALALCARVLTETPHSVPDE